MIRPLSKLSRVAAIASALVLFTACADEPAAETPPDSNAESSAPSTSPAPQDDSAGGNSSELETPTGDSRALRFEDDTLASGVEFKHAAGLSEDRFLPEIMGGGLAIVDLNRDGAPDLFFVDSGKVMLEGTVPGKHGLFLNQGDGSFRDASAEWGLDAVDSGYGFGVAAGDLDDDGWTDLVLTSFGGPVQLLRNTGSGLEPFGANLELPADERWETSAGVLDIENDGDLDLWVQRFIDFDAATAEDCHRDGVHIYCTPTLYAPVADILLRNDGTRFTDISEESGLDALPNFGLALVTADIDLDGDTDVYSANDISANQLWSNDGEGRFEEIAGPVGAAYSAEGENQAGMGTDTSDIDGDGRIDLVSANFEDETTSVYRQVAPMVFQEVSDRLGVGMTARDHLSWGVEFFDADNDGDEDLLVANGHLWDNISSFSESRTHAQPNSLYLNESGSFAPIVASAEAADALSAAGVSRAIAASDLDGDGLLDYVVANNDGRAQVARNSSENRGNFVSLWLEGVEANRNAVGAWVEAEIDGRTVVRTVNGASSYLTAPDYRVHLGLGDASQVDRLVIHWPGADSEPQVIESLPAGAFYHIVQGEEATPFVPGAAVIAP